MNNELKGAWYAILSGFLYGFIGYFGMTIIHENLSISTMTFWRFLISAVAIALLIIPNIKQYTFNLSDGIKTMLNGALFYAPSTLLYFKASSLIGSGLAMVIFFTYPAIVMLINYFLFRQNISRLYYISIAVISFGMIMLVDWKQFHADILGITLQLISAAFYGAYMVSSKRVAMNPMLSAFWVSVGCTLLALIVSLLQQNLCIPDTPKLLWHLLGIGILCTAVPILLLLKSMHFISAEKASILSVTEPVFVVIVGVLLLGELISLKETLGIVIILAGAVMVLFTSRPKASSAYEATSIARDEPK